MRPDRFGQGRGREFTESAGRERDHPFSGVESYAGIGFQAFWSGFPVYRPGDWSGVVGGADIFSRNDMTTPDAYRKARYTSSHTWISGSDINGPIYSTSAQEFTLEYPRIGLLNQGNGGLVFEIISASGPAGFNERDSWITNGSSDIQTETSRTFSNRVVSGPDSSVPGTLIEEWSYQVQLEGELIPWSPIYDELRAIFDNLNEYEFRPGEPRSSGQVISGGPNGIGGLFNHQAGVILESFGLSSALSLRRGVGSGGSFSPPRLALILVPQIGWSLVLSKRLVPVQLEYADWVVLRTQVLQLEEKSCIRSAGVELLDAPQYDGEFEPFVGDIMVLEHYGFGPDVWTAGGQFGSVRPSCL